MKNRKTRRKIYTESNAKQYTYDQPYTKCDRICPAKKSLPVFFPLFKHRQYGCSYNQANSPDLNTSQE